MSSPSNTPTSLGSGLGRDSSPSILSEDSDSQFVQGGVLGQNSPSIESEASQFEAARNNREVRAMVLAAMRAYRAQHETPAQRAAREARQQRIQRERREHRRIRAIVEGGYDDGSSGADYNYDGYVFDEDAVMEDAVMANAWERHEDPDEHMSDSSSEGGDQPAGQAPEDREDNGATYTNFPPRLQAQCPHFMRIMRALADGDPGVLSTFAILYYGLYDAIRDVGGYSGRAGFAWARQFGLLAEEVPNGAEIFPSIREMTNEVESYLRAQGREADRGMNGYFEGVDDSSSEISPMDVRPIVDENGRRGERVRHYCAHCGEYHEFDVFPSRDGRAAGEQAASDSDEGSEQDESDNPPDEQGNATTNEEDGRSQRPQTPNDNAVVYIRPRRRLVSSLPRGVRVANANPIDDDAQNEGAQTDTDEAGLRIPLARLQQELSRLRDGLRNGFSALPGILRRNHTLNEGNGQTATRTSLDRGSPPFGSPAPSGEQASSRTRPVRDNRTNTADVDDEWLEEAMSEEFQEHQFPRPGPPR